MRQGLLLRRTNEMLEAGTALSEIDAHPDIQAMDIRIRATDEYLDERQADLEIRRRQDRAPTGTVEF